MISQNYIGIVICYFGRWPNWFHLFLKSIVQNNEIDWIVFSDNILKTNFDNVKFIEFSINRFNKLATKKLGIRINISNPYKLCDFKPAYGIIFEDYLKKYLFWGYSDIDIIYGNIFNFINNEVLNKYDIISFYRQFLSGPFCIYRNVEFVNKLYTKSIYYPKIFLTDQHIGFDENILRKGNYGLSFRKIINAVKIKKYYKRGFYNTLTIKDIRSQFQWYFKKINIKSDALIDMTDIIWYYSKYHYIKSYFRDLIFSDRYFNRINYNWKIEWNHKNLIELNSKKYIFGFHFVDKKYNPDWEIITKNKFFEKISITKRSIIVE